MFYDFVGEGWAKLSAAYKIRPNITMSQQICEQVLGTVIYNIQDQKRINFKILFVGT